MNAGYSNISILAHAHFEHALTTPTQTAWLIGKPSSNEFCPAWYQNSMSTYRNWWGLLSTKLCSIYDKSIRPNFFQFSTKVFDKKCFNFRQNVRQIVRQSVRRNRSTKIVSIFDKNVRQKCFEVNSRRFWLFPANNWTDSGFIFVQNWFLSIGLVVWKLVLTIFRRNILSEGFGRMYVPSYFRRGPFAPICKPFRFQVFFPGQCAATFQTDWFSRYFPRLPRPAILQRFFMFRASIPGAPVARLCNKFVSQVFLPAHVLFAMHHLWVILK